MWLALLTALVAFITGPEVQSFWDWLLSLFSAV